MMGGDRVLVVGGPSFVSHRPGDGRPHTIARVTRDRFRLFHRLFRCPNKQRTQAETRLDVAQDAAVKILLIQKDGKTASEISEDSQG
jgi:hypothetical protein